jgi:hypothetical protein
MLTEVVQKGYSNFSIGWPGASTHQLINRLRSVSLRPCTVFPTGPANVGFADEMPVAAVFFGMSGFHNGSRQRGEKTCNVQGRDPQA